MTNTLNKIIHNGDEYNLPSYTAWTWLTLNWTEFSADTTVLATQTDLASKQAQHSTLSLTLASADWSSNTITVTATWVTASNTVIVAPGPSSMADYTDWGVYCSSQASNSLTFVCDTEPSNDIDVNVVILN